MSITGGQYIRLDRMLTRGYLKRVGMLLGQRYSPPSGYCWLVLSGALYHVNGTETRLEVRTVEDKVIFQTSIDSTMPSGTYPMFNTASDVKQAQQPPLLIIDENSCVTVASTGGVGQSYLYVLEWKNQ